MEIPQALEPKLDNLTFLKKNSTKQTPKLLDFAVNIPELENSDIDDVFHIIDQEFQSCNYQVALEVIQLLEQTHKIAYFKIKYLMSFRIYYLIL